ncbi:MAG: hypothetical protein UX07_C0026G0012 [Parcubacteria group bacterium GW2011_GWA2_45_30]|nr:MAG: hypothetical protein UX07_C0026G0012 [Parcubacteria group bacterium GW2011_GWA2_45_30]
MLDPIFIKRKIKFIQEDLKRLEIFKGFTINEIASDWMKWNSLEWTLAKIIGRALDINRHVIAELARADIEPPAKHRETFLRLANLKVLPKDFAEKIAESAGFRNRVIHEYNNLDKNKVYETVNEALEQYANYCRYLLEYLDKSH